MGTGTKDSRKYRARKTATLKAATKPKSQRQIMMDILIGEKGKEKSIKEALRLTNPNYDPGDPYYSNNCQKCIWAYEALRRGYDVEAKPIKPGENCDVMDPFEPESWVNVAEGGLNMVHIWNSNNIIASPTRQDIIDSIVSNNPKKSRGVIAMSDSTTWSGHVINWEISGRGNVIFYDAQDGTKWDPADFGDYDTFYWGRMDNVTFSHTIGLFVKKRQ